MRIIFSGSRNWMNEPIVLDMLKMIISKFEKDQVTIVVGGAKGLDQIAENLAKSLHLKVDVFYADWDLHGKAAGPIRNQKMLDSGADLLVAFPSKDSKGTRHMIDISQKAGIKTIIYENCKWIVTKPK
jgi:hypothetical protein